MGFRCCAESFPTERVPKRSETMITSNSSHDLNPFLVGLFVRVALPSTLSVRVEGLDAYACELPSVGVEEIKSFRLQTFHPSTAVGNDGFMVGSATRSSFSLRLR